MSYFRIVDALMSTSRYDKLGGVRSLQSPDISVLGHFGPWARLVCRQLASGCSGVSRVSMVRVGYRLKVRVKDQCDQRVKCPMSEVTVHQFVPIYHTEIITIALCMYAKYVVWNGGSVGLVDNCFTVGLSVPNGNGQIFFFCGGEGRGNHTTQCRPNV